MIRGAAATGTFTVNLPRGFWIARAITGATATALQLAGLYAAVVTFGVWTTLGLYTVGGLVLFLQQVILSRSTPCSLGG
jgi:hypothetical protein